MIENAGIGKYINSPKGTCLFGASIYDSGTQITLDSCTSCSCSNSTLHCERQNCPVLRCKPEFQKTLRGRCCAECRKLPESASQIKDDLKEMVSKSPVKNAKLPIFAEEDEDENFETEYDVHVSPQTNDNDDDDVPFKVPIGLGVNAHIKGSCSHAGKTYKVSNLNSYI